jgi:hypothetical protein
MPNISWKMQNAMRIKFRRIKVPHPGSLSTLILEAFIQNGGLIPAREYYGSEHEVKGKKYQQWVDDLRSLGIIEPYKADDLERKGDDWIRFKPGKVIRDYINKEKAHQEEMASMRDVYESEARFDAKKADRTELEETKRELQETKSKFQAASTKLEETSSKLEETNRVVAKIAVAVRKLQLAKEPPITDNKIALQRQAEHELEENTRALVN